LNNAILKYMYSKSFIVESFPRGSLSYRFLQNKLPTKLKRKKLMLIKIVKYVFVLLFLVKIKISFYLETLN